MAPLATAFIRVEADDKAFLTKVDKSGKTASSNLHKTMSDGGTKAGKGFGDTFSKASLASMAGLGKSANLLIAGGVVAGVGAVTAVFKTGFSELADYQKGLAQTNAVLKSTGALLGSRRKTSKA
jgi:hypothetical protein